MLSLPCIAELKEGVCLTLLPVSLFTIISHSLSTGIFLTRTNVKAVFCSEDTAGRKDQWKLQLAFLWKSPEKVITLILLSTYLLSNQNITNSVSGRQLKFSFKLFPLRFVIGLVVAPWSRVTASCTSATIKLLSTHISCCPQHSPCSLWPGGPVAADWRLPRSYHMWLYKLVSPHCTAPPGAEVVS